MCGIYARFMTDDYEADSPSYSESVELNWKTDWISLRFRIHQHSGDQLFLKSTSFNQYGILNAFSSPDEEFSSILQHHCIETECLEGTCVSGFYISYCFFISRKIVYKTNYLSLQNIALENTTASCMDRENWTTGWLLYVSQGENLEVRKLFYFT